MSADLTTWSLARRSAWAHRSGFTGTALVLVLAGLLVAVAGVLGESGARDGGLLVVLASSYAGTLLAVVVLVVASTVSLALRGRRTELALLRTVGATRGQLRTQIGTEVALVALVAVPIGAAAGLLVAPLLTPLLREAGLVGAGDSLTLSPIPVLVATVLLLPVTWLAARLSVRETLRAAPGPAARASAVETTTVGLVRRGAAAALGLLGLAAALSPLFVPGTVGGASAAMSAFLLVGAAALAGPALVGWAFGHTARAERFLGPAGRLGVANLRGFAQRLTLVVVPLALALTAGTAQTTVDSTVVAATEAQLRDGLQADLVATAPAGLAPDDVDAVSGLAGVSGTAALATLPARVLTDADMDGVVDSLAWEQTAVRSVAGDLSLIDPDVSDGSLADLARPGTVAVSGDATLETGVGVGDTVAVRWPDGTSGDLTVVAAYERGLGFGGYLVGPETLDAHRTERVADALLVDADASGRAAVAALGLETATPASYAADASSADAAERRLSTVLLLGLLGFVLLAAANALVMATVRRRGELRLLQRTGATSRQLTRMVLVEALLTGALAWLVGTLAVLPTIFGVGLGMLGPVLPPVDLAAYGVLSLTVLALPLITAVPAAMVVTAVVRRGRSA